MSNLGAVITNLPGGSGTGATLTFQADGKILVGGKAGNVFASDFALVRYNSDGTLDTTFDSDGIAITDFGSGIAYVNSAFVQADGKILAIGSNSNGLPFGSATYGIAKYLSDGSLDTSFGTNGLVSLGNDGWVYDAALQPDGKIVIAGVNSSGSLVVARCNADGSLDTSFGSGGLATAAQFSSAYLTIQSDGKLLVAGTTPSIGPTSHDFAVARFNVDGTPDTNFGSNGLITTDLGGNPDSANSITLQTDGKIIVAGTSFGSLAIVRYNQDGSLDSSFGDSGIAYPGVAGTVAGIALQVDGKILLVGTVDSGGTALNDIAIFRLTSNGTLDSTFSGDGKLIVDLPPGDGSVAQDNGSAITVEDDGTILVVGSTEQQGATKIALLHIEADGTLDPTFGTPSAPTSSTFTGGVEDNSYIVSHTTDVIIDAGGTDTVFSSVSYTLPTGIENLILTGSATIDGTGNALANTLSGNDGVNTLTGGAGNDTYVLGPGDLAIETSTLAGEIDTVLSSASYSLGANLENLTLTGSADIDATGNGLANTLTGNSGANTLDGGLADAKVDNLAGGAGDDTYLVDLANANLIQDSVTENFNEGTDTVVLRGGNTALASFSTLTLGANLEGLDASGTTVAKLNLTGNALNNTLTGNDAANTLDGGLGSDHLDGGAGIDTLKGGAGDDTYQVNLTAANLIQDSISEALNQGSDTVVLRGGNTGLASTVTLTLGANLEGLDASGTTNTKLNLTGNALTNTLTGNDAANLLNGGGGADTMSGGLGDDTYIVDNAGDVVTENPGEGSDLVKVAIALANGTYTLTDNVDNGTLINAVAYNLTGNDLANVLTGNGLNNTLDGGLGADSLVGGLGNDTYIVDNIGDTITDTGGSDTVKSSLTYTLGATLEHLVLTGAAAIDGTGNTLANTLTGNDGVNTLTGGLGNDTYILGAGDIAIETSTLASEIDSVLASASYSLGANLENLTLTGSAAIDGSGNSLVNLILGNSGANILDGGLADGKVDFLKGGDGNDTYQVDLTAANLIQDAITEALNQGSDTVVLRGGNTGLASTVTLTLGANLEGLDASGTTNTKLNLTGNALTNTLTGNDAANLLNGGGGADTMSGGLGDDTYIVDNAGDVVTENPGEGSDLVKVAIALANGTYTLTDNVDNGTLINAVAYNLVGNTLANTLTGNAAANTLDGGAGADSLIGGLGNDTYVIDDIGDTVTDTGGIDTVRSSIAYSLGATLEHLVLTGSADIDGTGNALANTLTGNDGVNTLTGGLGNDTYVLGAGDLAVETSALATEIDTVWSSATYTLGANLENLTLTGSSDIDGTGNGLVNTLTGNSGANTLDGGLSDGKVDALKGGAGDDTYQVDLTSANLIQDAITEALNEGTDTVVLRGGNTGLATTTTLLLSANLEGLDASGTTTAKLNLTGNALANTLTGNAADNVLDGGLGADDLLGGQGNDTYVIDNLGDDISEALGEGTDLAKVAIATANGTYTLGANLENGTLINAVAYNLTGNALANTLTGNALNNTLDGGTGADSLIGGLGNDTYVIDDAGDTVTDTGGIDTVRSSIAYSLGATLEHLVLTGSADIDGSGNGLANTLIGNGGANSLSGGLGNDVLEGGLGDDRFIFNTPLNALANVDRVKDFAVGDLIVLQNPAFASLGGSLTGDEFVAGAGVTAAATANQHVIYNTTTGALYYDADGLGGSAATLFAYVNDGVSASSHPILGVGDFQVI